MDSMVQRGEGSLLLQMVSRSSHNCMLAAPMEESIFTAVKGMAVLTTHARSIR